MQRSRRALLQRRALERTISVRNRLYKVSLSLVFVLWGLVFLVSLWTSRGHGHSDEFGVMLGVSTGKKANAALDQGSVCFEQNSFSETNFRVIHESLCTEDKGSLFIETDCSSETDSRVSHESSCTNGEADSTGAVSNPEKELSRTERTVPPSFDEFKAKVYNSRSKFIGDQAGGVKHRVEPGGTEYNYASSLKGAKVLANNKEAKGALNILCKDEDKYLRNPCSAEEKFVVIELSEETLVDTIKIANFEHYSSTLKDFELLGSLVYPSDQWVSLGNFTAAKVKLAQSFALQEPKWVRYLRLDLRSHYGSEFYCTLSVLEVYGVDAVERMLEDLISVQDNLFLSEPESPKEDGIHHQNELKPDSGPELSKADHEVTKYIKFDPTEKNEKYKLQPGRMPGDAVLKILMQKVQSLGLDLSVLEWYSEDMNSKYGNALEGITEEIKKKDALMEKISADMEDFIVSKEAIGKDVRDLLSWKSLVSVQLDNLAQDNALLRSEMEKMKENQTEMENKGTTVFAGCLFFGLIAFVRMMVHVARNGNETGEFCVSPWVLLLLSCTAVIAILSL